MKTQALNRTLCKAKNSKREAAALYEQSSRLWEGLVESENISDDLKKIADMEE